MLRALRAEFAKLTRSRVPIWTALVVLTWPNFTVGMLRIMDSPLESTTLEDFMRMGVQSIASWYGVLLFGFIAAYLFGREYSEGTVRNMLTLTVRREYFMLSKLIVVLAWVFGLAALAIAAQVGYAAVLGLRGFAWEHILRGGADSMLVTLIIAATLPFIGWLAIIGRGYLVPMIFSGVAFTSGMVFLQIGWEQWSPWSMPLTVAGSSWIPQEVDAPLVTGSWVVLAALFLLGVAAILIHIDHADNFE